MKLILPSKIEVFCVRKVWKELTPEKKIIEIPETPVKVKKGTKTIILILKYKPPERKKILLPENLKVFKIPTNLKY